MNAYGASTWGQFFIYQGFNERAGWMHTSSGVDNIDEYLETIVKKGDGFSYRYGAEERPLTAATITVPYKSGTGMAQKDFTVYRTHHGPIVREADGKWVSVRLMQEPLKALTQSYSRTKAKSYKAFRETMDLHTNSSNNTIYADADGTIAYFHSNFIPKRDARFDWTKPVDGSDPATEWNGVHSDRRDARADEPRQRLALQHEQLAVVGGRPEQPEEEQIIPPTWSEASENPRGIHAIRVLEKKKDFTLDSLVAAAYDSYLPAFETLIPSLVKAYDQAPASSPLKAKLAEQIELLRDWDYRWAVDVGADRAGRLLGRGALAARDCRCTQGRCVGLSSTSKPGHPRSSGSTLWRRPRTSSPPISGAGKRRGVTSIDSSASPGTSSSRSTMRGRASRSGSRRRGGARWRHSARAAIQGSKKMYGTSGNSFVAVVEFGDTVRARAITAGGESGDPGSPHFNDQAARYSTGDLRDVYFYRPQLEGHIKRQYRPGE